MTGRGVLLSSLLLFLGAGRALAGIPPAGFQETVFLSGLGQVDAFEWAPNGDLWILDKGGLVSVVRDGTTTPVPILQLTVDTTDERGLLGLALDPAFPVNGFVYLYYTVPGTAPFNRVSRFRSVGDQLLDETVLLEGPPLTTVFHNSGCLRFGDDGLLYISMGDNAHPGVSQELDNLLGKILRIAPDGSIPPTNPLVGDPNARPEIWAWGLRNPWRFNVQPGTGNLFIGDVGDGTWEEIDLGVAGANYGYPLVEGPSPPGVAGMTYPIFSYPHNGGSAAVTGGDHMVAGNFPSQYVGDYFYGDYSQQKIFRMTLDVNNMPTGNEEFVSNASGPVHIRVGPDGALYYASILTSTVYRVAWVGGTNQAPVAALSADVTSGLPPFNVQFDGSGSFDPDGGTLSYLLYFDDETPPSTTASPLHTYTATGVFHPNLTVSDGQDSSTARIRVVSGNRAPAAAILAPADGAHFDGGDVISFSGSAVDPEEGALGPSAFTWWIVFHHNIHTHPYLGPTPGITGGTFVTADAGETDPDVWYEIRLVATDTGVPLGAGAEVSDTKVVSIYPNLARMSFHTTPRDDLGLTLDGKPFVPPRDVTGVVGVRRTIGAVSPQTPGDGHAYVFTGWSDGGAASHEIVTPAADQTFTAAYGCDLLAEATDLEVSAGAMGQVTLSWTPPSDPCMSSGPAVYHVYTATSATPSSPPGGFPSDPLFAPVATTTLPSVTLPAGAAGMLYFVVVGQGSDGAEGPAGHYGG